MKKWLEGLLGITAVTSSAILNDGKHHMARIVANTSAYWGYTGIGVGNNTAVNATSGNTKLFGNNTYATVATNVSYEADYKAVWQHTFNYSDITDHKFSEAVVCKDATTITDSSLARIVYDQITLNLSDTLQITVKVAF